MSTSLVAVGECMLELVPKSDGQFQTGFAGDTYNALVYAGQCFPNLDLGYFTGVGNDQVSRQMQNAWLSYGISDRFAQADPSRSIGIYAISTDATGERSFQYWRAGSAASAIFKEQSVLELKKELKDCDWLFFSGISLGIFDTEDRRQFLALIKGLKSDDKTIVFDPNYRPSMFQSKGDAIDWLTQCYQLADVVLPGLDEHQEIWGHQDADEVIDFCVALGVKEVVVKAGSNGVIAIGESGELYHRPFQPAAQQIDTTAAGDSFAGVYIASRMSGVTIDKSIDNAANVAREVVQHKGAILANDVLQPIINRDLVTQAL